MIRSNLKIIKLIGRPDYEVELLESKHGYYIRSEQRGDETEYFSDLIQDLHMANYMFDLKLRDLEGH